MGFGVPTYNFSDQVALGTVSGVIPVFKYGYNDEVGTSEEAIWSSGGAYTGFISAAEFVEVSSTSSSDAAAGVGLRQTMIFGLGYDLRAQHETVTLNGLSAVTTKKRFFRVYRMTNTASGTNEKNVGTVSAVGATSGNKLAEMPAAYGQTEMCVYAVPLGSKAVLTGLLLESDVAKLIDVRFNVAYIDPDTKLRRFAIGSRLGASGGVSNLDADPGVVVAGPADVWLSGIAASGASNYASAQLVGKEYSIA